MEQSDVLALEAELSAIPQVKAARVVAGPSGRITEVHVISEGGKTPKQLVRDVQTVAQAKLGLPIDHRIVSVVQFPNGSTPSARPRFQLASLSWTIEGSRATCRVRIEIGDEGADGEASGPATSGARARLTAEATAKALAHLTDDDPVVDISDVAILDVGSTRIAVAVVLFLIGDTREIVVTGSAPVLRDESDAIARAIIDAVTRHHGA